VLSQIVSNELLPRHPQHFFLILIQLRVVIRWSLEEDITASESWRQMQELPSCPLEETLQSIMEIDSVCVSNLETTANRNPTRRDTINHNRRDVSVCSERSRSPAVFSVKYHCIIIKAGACWVITLLQSQSEVTENGFTFHCREVWLEPCIVSSINCRSSSEWCAI